MVCLMAITMAAGGAQGGGKPGCRQLNAILEHRVDALPQDGRDEM